MSTLRCKSVNLISEFIPEEVKNFYKSLTPEDKQILRELASKHATFANEDEALDALKQKSVKLYNKANELRNFVKGKIDSLSPNAKQFIEEVSSFLLIKHFLYTA